MNNTLENDLASLKNVCLSRILVYLKKRTLLLIIEAVFSAENYVPSTTIWVSRHAYCSLLCHNGPSIISRESMHKHNLIKL